VWIGEKFVGLSNKFSTSKFRIEVKTGYEIQYTCITASRERNGEQEMFQIERNWTSETAGQKAFRPCSIAKTQKIKIRSVQFNGASIAEILD